MVDKVTYYFTFTDENGVFVVGQVDEGTEYSVRELARYYPDVNYFAVCLPEDEKQPREWVDENSKVPDLTPAVVWLPNPCWNRHKEGWYCTRLQHHTGRHAAGNGRHIVAVWGDE